jgi:hypothetical protein
VRRAGDVLPLDRVSIFDTGLELFVIVPSSTRGRRKDIALALSVAQSLSSESRHVRPFMSPVHALVFPTVVPKDLAVLFRDRKMIDELVRVVSLFFDI